MIRDIFTEPIRCNSCGASLNSENYSGWYEIGETPLGITTNMPICNQCNLLDDGSDRNGAY